MIKAYFDGSCVPNADGGTMGVGAVIYNDGKKIHEISERYQRRDGVASNNIAEYCAFGILCKYLVDFDLTDQRIAIYGDSKLVIEQMNNRWSVNSGKYINYAIRALMLLSEFKCRPGIVWIPRQMNSVADELSRSRT